MTEHCYCCHGEISSTEDRGNIGSSFTHLECQEKFDGLEQNGNAFIVAEMTGFQPDKAIPYARLVLTISGVFRGTLSHDQHGTVLVLRSNRIKDPEKPISELYSLFYLSCLAYG